jgi:hypothetical protein
MEDSELSYKWSLSEIPELLNRNSLKVKTITEGGIGPDEINYLIDFLKKETGIKTILEIGFNSGISTMAFLAARPDLTVISVDIGSHDYVLQAKEWIDQEFPNRHMLIIGDSTTVLPQLLNQFTMYKPDMIFVDGNHDGEYPKKDIYNSIALAHPDTFIIIDDVVPWMKDIHSAIDQFVQSSMLQIIDHKESDIWGWTVCKVTI